MKQDNKRQFWLSGFKHEKESTNGQLLTSTHCRRDLQRIKTVLRSNFVRDSNIDEGRVRVGFRVKEETSFQ